MCVTSDPLVVYCIPKDAKNPDAGWQFLDYFTSDEGGKVFGETLFYIPVRKSAASTSVTLPPGEKPEHVKLFVDAMPFNRGINFTNNTERARQIYRPELTRAFRCEVSAKTALEGVKKQVEDSLVGVY
jgi:multiple sugar transport system substrate-binding protein